MAAPLQTVQLVNVHRHLFWPQLIRKFSITSRSRVSIHLDLTYELGLKRIWKRWAPLPWIGAWWPPSNGHHTYIGYHAEFGQTAKIGPSCSSRQLEVIESDRVWSGTYDLLVIHNRLVSKRYCPYQVEKKFDDMYNSFYSSLPDGPKYSYQHFAPECWHVIKQSHSIHASIKSDEIVS